MKKIVLSSDFKTNESIEITKFLIGYGQTILLGIANEGKNEDAKNLSNSININLPWREGREKEERFYKNESARFIAGLALEHDTISLVFDSINNIQNLNDALLIQEDLVSYIDRILIFSDTIKELSNEKTIEKLNSIKDLILNKIIIGSIKEYRSHIFSLTEPTSFNMEVKQNLFFIKEDYNKSTHENIFIEKLEKTNRISK